LRRRASTYRLGGGKVSDANRTECSDGNTAKDVKKAQTGLVSPVTQFLLAINPLGQATKRKAAKGETEAKTMGYFHPGAHANVRTSPKTNSMHGGLKSKKRTGAPSVTLAVFTIVLRVGWRHGRTEFLVGVKEKVRINPLRGNGCQRGDRRVQARPRVRAR